MGKKELLFLKRKFKEMGDSLSKHVGIQCRAKRAGIDKSFFFLFKV
jgi:hypothetical protein